MSAWPKVRVRELGLKSSHIDGQRRGQEGSSHPHTRRCTDFTHTVAKVILRGHSRKFCGQRHAEREGGRGRKNRGQGVRCRARKVGSRSR